MTALARRAWGWVRPAMSYRPWGSRSVSENAGADEGHARSSWGLVEMTAWFWGGKKTPNDQANLTEQFWEAEEKLQPMEIKDLGASETLTVVVAESSPRWWRRVVRSTLSLWQGGSAGLRQRKAVGWSEGAWDDSGGDLSDYGTPPPSPRPSPTTLASPFRFFARSWGGEVLPEHYEICFNFLRHLFDLLVVGFLWSASPPTKLVLEVLGVQGALKLWLHGMALFLVSTVGMAGLLWLVQEYLPQFALVYGIVQALVISVSVRQSIILGGGEEEEESIDPRTSVEP